MRYLSLIFVFVFWGCKCEAQLSPENEHRLKYGPVILFSTNGDVEIRGDTIKAIKWLLRVYEESEVKLNKVITSGAEWSNYVPDIFKNGNCVWVNYRKLMEEQNIIFFKNKTGKIKKCK